MKRIQLLNLINKKFISTGKLKTLDRARWDECRKRFFVSGILSLAAIKKSFAKLNFPTNRFS